MRRKDDVNADLNTDDFGARLKEARLRKGVTLRSIADATRISVSVLEALERNDISKLPGGLFSRAFVRAYAGEIGLDAERTVELFLERFPHDSVKVGHTSSLGWDEVEARDQRRRVLSFVLRAVALVLVVGGAIAYLWSSGSSSSLTRQATALVAAVAPVVTLPSMPRFDSNTAPLVIALAASRACSGSSAVDGRLPQPFVLVAGEQLTIEATTELSLALSEADAVTMTINGLPARPLGGPESVQIRLTADDYRTYVNQ
jgi:transcriptional regulator with XRE-family HTH domain